jgi:hypothetical protein
MPTVTPAKTVAGVTVAVLLSLYGTVDFYGKQIERNKIQKDAYQIGAQERRFEALKRELPADGVAGYVSDIDDTGILLTAQYALAPVLLVDNVPYRLVVGNFSKAMDYAEFARARKLVLVKDFGNGVTLFHKID